MAGSAAVGAGDGPAAVVVEAAVAGIAAIVVAIVAEIAAVVVAGKFFHEFSTGEVMTNGELKPLPASLIEITTLF